MSSIHTELREWARELKRAGVAVPKHGDSEPPRLRVYLWTPRASNSNTYEDVLKRRRIKGFRKWRGVVIVTGGPGDELPARGEAKRFGGHGNRLSFETFDAFRDWAVAAIETAGRPSPSSLTVRVPEADRAWLEAEAERRGLSEPSMLRELIRAAGASRP